ncbi:MAG: histidinol-phosphatase HisJ family protein [Ruminococcaceae bacterium]|nr:histidinol-phosphatase HisJ family protein [Oscillospiraceae bacterium]
MKTMDLHIHSTFSDGRSTPEEIVLFAIEKGLCVIGFSDHSETAFDPGYCMKREDYGAYRREISSLKEKYKDSIRILCGIEQDLYSDPVDADEGFDYIIGSVHYVRKGEHFLPVDKSASDLKNSVLEYYSGDYLAFAEDYYKAVAEIPKKTNADIIGHFDLVTKFNEREPLIDESSERYIKAWRAAADKLLESGIPFEVNTGVIVRGYKSHPYPARQILTYLLSRGASFVLSGDSHRAANVAFEFPRWEEYIKGLKG